MGTNFYVKSEPCKCCGRSEEDIHLGKSSVGWKFMLQSNDFNHYVNWLEMKGWLVGKKIENEYGESITLEKFAKWVESNQLVMENEDEFHQTGCVYLKGYKFYNGEFS